MLPGNSDSQGDLAVSRAAEICLVPLLELALQIIQRIH